MSNIHNTNQYNTIISLHIFCNLGQPIGITSKGVPHVIAGVIHRNLRSDLSEIEPAMPYPNDYSQTVEQAKFERDRDLWPTLKNQCQQY